MYSTGEIPNPTPAWGTFGSPPKYQTEPGAELARLSISLPVSLVDPLRMSMKINLFLLGIDPASLE